MDNVVTALKIAAVAVVLYAIGIAVSIIFLSKFWLWTVIACLTLALLVAFIVVGLIILLPMIGLSGGDDEDAQAYEDQTAAE